MYPGGLDFLPEDLSLSLCHTHTHTHTHAGVRVYQDDPLILVYLT